MPDARGAAVIRLMIWGLLFGAGAWVGMEVQKALSIRACLDAGGGVDPRGFCVGRIDG